MPARTPGSPGGREARSRRTRPAGAAIEIRDAAAADVPALARLGARLAREHHELDPERFFVPEEPLEDGYAWWLAKERRNPRAVVLAATRRGRIVGYAYGRIEPRDWNTLRDRCGVGVDLWVEPRARQGGVPPRTVPRDLHVLDPDLHAVALVAPGCGLGVIERQVGMDRPEPLDEPLHVAGRNGVIVEEEDIQLPTYRPDPIPKGPAEPFWWRRKSSLSEQAVGHRAVLRVTTSSKPS